MSALAQSPPSFAPSERRIGRRIRLDRVLPARIGRHDGTLVDLSMRGAKIRHAGSLQRGATVRITFPWDRVRFSAVAETLSSRILALGMGKDASPMYESRLHFVYIDPAAFRLLQRVLSALEDEMLRTWVGNLYATGETIRLLPPVACGFLRCRPVGTGWETKWTREKTQPEDGFLLPAETDSSDLRTLCRAWESMNKDSRHLVRLIAAAVVEGTLGA